MPAFEPPAVDPTERPAEDLTLPERLDLTFEGFGPDAFALLERLRRHPHIEQYRTEKPGIERVLKAPFRRFRDDLVVNWVLPNRLAFETERNVFSRLLKNDFGAGGCHHHLWMAFYRPGFRRLTDLQLSHGISPDGFTTGLFVGEYGQALLRRARAQIEQAPDVFLRLVNPLLAQPGWRFAWTHGRRTSRAQPLAEAPLDDVSEALATARSLWVRRTFPREDVIAWQSGLVRQALEAVMALWPLYRFLAGTRPA